MKTLFTFLAVLAICVLLFFFAEYHSPAENTDDAYTLAGFYGRFLKDISLLTVARFDIVLSGIAGLVTAFLPVFLVIFLRFIPNKFGFFILSGIIAVIGTVTNFVLMIWSQPSDLLHGASSTSSETIFFWLITIFQLTIAILSFAFGAIPKWANAVQNGLST